MTEHTALTITGNLTADPDLRYTDTGIAVTSFTVAATPRVLDRTENTYRDGDTIFLRCVMWRRPAEIAADSLRRGMRVLAHGRLRQRTLTHEGSTHTVTELDVEEIGPTLRYATVAVTTQPRRGGEELTPEASEQADAPHAAPQEGHR